MKIVNQILRQFIESIARSEMPAGSDSMKAGKLNL